MQLKPNFYKDRVCLNVLANSLDNAKEVYESANGYVLVGLLSKNYVDVQSAVADMKIYSEAINNAISVGLGAGDAKQSSVVTEIVKQLKPQHINQVFTGAAHSRIAVANNDTFINALCSPTGIVGKIKISTGAISSTFEDAIVSVPTAIAMLKDMGANSIKFFNMQGLKFKDEYIEVAKCCAKYDFAIEPTGGIDLSNFEEIMKIAINAGVKEVIPHIYTSIIDKQTGKTNTGDVKQLLSITDKLLN